MFCFLHFTLACTPTASDGVKPVPRWRFSDLAPLKCYGPFIRELESLTVTANSARCGLIVRYISLMVPFFSRGRVVRLGPHPASRAGRPRSLLVCVAAWRSPRNSSCKSADGVGLNLVLRDWLLAFRKWAQINCSMNTGCLISMTWKPSPQRAGQTGTFTKTFI